jgi:hypothetical protein
VERKIVGDTASTLNVLQANIGVLNKDSLTNTSSTAVSGVDTTTVANVAVSRDNTFASSFNLIGKGAEVNTSGEWKKATIIDRETEFLY